jgi:hypothetical protein
MKRNYVLKAFIALVAVAVSQLATAGNIDEVAARSAASSFIRQQASAGKFNAAAGAQLSLTHVEASKAVAGANDYYVYNLEGGGWIIIAGEDRAATVLGYSDQGRLDFSNLPYNFKGLLNSYKREIEYLQTYTADDLVRVESSGNLKEVVAPLIKTTWGQEMPYYLQCPLYQNEYCVVGCVATAMAQVMKYWQYPQECNGVASYYCYNIGGYVPALPATTFDYNLMLDSYCHWDYNTSTLVQDTYTDAQAQEVAKLSRYCGQAVEMSYSPEGSGAYTSDQLAAMKAFGYRSTAQDVRKNGYMYGSYTTAEWEEMMRTELLAGRPILYSADDYSEGGHAFICDGLSGDGKFHFNFGWYGTCDGWFVSTALNVTHREGDELHFNWDHEMLIGVQPPEGWEPPVTVTPGDANADGKVDVNDVTTVINFILGKNPNPFNEANADVNGSGDVNVMDVTLIINIILNTQQ